MPGKRGGDLRSGRKSKGKRRLAVLVYDWRRPCLKTKKIGPTKTATLVANLGGSIWRPTYSIANVGKSPITSCWTSPKGGGAKKTQCITGGWRPMVGQGIKFKRGRGRGTDHSLTRAVKGM